MYAVRCMLTATHTYIVPSQTHAVCENFAIAISVAIRVYYINGPWYTFNVKQNKDLVSLHDCNIIFSSHKAPFACLLFKILLW